MAGYSGTPLVKKLGIKDGYMGLVRNPPIEYARLVENLPESFQLSKTWKKGLNFVHIFSKKQTELFRLIETARNYIAADGMIWASWPKKASGVPTDITEDRIREFGPGIDLVDVKVCAIDETWSGLKLVIRKEKR
ncbi:MAG: DUF3052 domain-containing protein [Leptospiraceae bacterium]|nr:DUF3052 domain-containing protein [Leptospiraceae bacterium]